MPDSCRSCATTPVEPHTDRTPRCTVCVRYAAVVSNARRVRRDGKAPGLRMTRAAFAAWFTGQIRCCAYCGIRESQIVRLNLLTQVGQPLQRLGVDRIDAALPYQVGNIMLACFACNKAKSNTFSCDEMTVIGAAIAEVWRRRTLALTPFD